MTKARIGPLGKLDCWDYKIKCFLLKNGRFLNQFLGWSVTEPSTPVNHDLHVSEHLGNGQPLKAFTSREFK